MGGAWEWRTQCRWPGPPPALWPGRWAPNRTRRSCLRQATRCHIQPTPRTIPPPPQAPPLSQLPNYLLTSTPSEGRLLPMAGKSGAGICPNRGRIPAPPWAACRPCSRSSCFLSRSASLSCSCWWRAISVSGEGGEGRVVCVCVCVCVCTRTLPQHQGLVLLLDGVHLLLDVGLHLLQPLLQLLFLCLLLLKVCLPPQGNVVLQTAWRGESRGGLSLTGGREGGRGR